MMRVLSLAAPQWRTRKSPSYRRASGGDGQTTPDELGPLTGSAYEAEDLRAQIEDHESDLKKLANQVGTTKNGTLRQFASETGLLLEQLLALPEAVQTASKAR